MGTDKHNHRLAVQRKICTGYQGGKRKCGAALCRRRECLHFTHALCSATLCLLRSGLWLGIISAQLNIISLPRRASTVLSRTTPLPLEGSPMLHIYHVCHLSHQVTPPNAALQVLALCCNHPVQQVLSCHRGLRAVKQAPYEWNLMSGTI